MNQLTKEQQEEAKKLLEMMSGKPEKKNWASVFVLFLLLMGFIAIIIFVPIWAKVLVVLYVLYRVFSNREKLKEMFS
ncbi:MAG: hypothetical protein OEX81_01385 [Candidatus Pacebacteria bacterium]|nr:hypothetical protein [Candidatus Paceibacterota bacterium]